MELTLTVDDLDAIQALTHPTRLKMLERLREPASAAGVARALGEPRQKINYHLKELERAGLVKPTGERRKGNVMEQLFQASAGTFLISPRLGWGDGPRLATLRAQAAIAALVDLGERLQRDAAILLERAAYGGETIASAAVEAEVSFADEEARQAFMREYLAALGPLLRKYAVRRGLEDRYRVMLAVYPEPEEGTKQ